MEEAADDGSPGSGWRGGERGRSVRVTVPRRWIILVTNRVLEFRDHGEQNEKALVNKTKPLTGSAEPATSAVQGIILTGANSPAA
jgi:hypothetical protein